MKVLALIRKFHRHLLAVLAGVVLALAFPKFNLAGAAWVGPALLLASAHGLTPGAAWRIGYLSGLVFWLTTLSWLLAIPVTGFPILGWAALCAFLAIYPATWVWFLAGRIGRGTWLWRCFWCLSGAAAWVALEMIRSRLFSGFPWSPLGATQWELTPLIQIAAVTGVYGVSFLVVWMALAFYSSVGTLLRNPTTRYIWLGEIIFPLIVVIVVFNQGLSRLHQMPAEEAALRVTLVQPSVPQTMIWNPDENSARFDHLVSLTKTALTNKTDLLLWPEAAVPDLDYDTFATITNLVRHRHVWMLFCADEVRPKLGQTTSSNAWEVFNSALWLNPAGALTGSYHKRQLVIFGEYVPLIDYLPFVKWFTPITGAYTPGREVTQFNLEHPFATHDVPDYEDSPDPETELVAPAHTRLAPLICFEDVFPHHVREHVNAETDLLVNLTNDGWFGDGAAQWQQAASAAFRAVENGVPLLRACNNGVTCWFDAAGRMREVFQDAEGSEYGPGFAHWRVTYAPAAKRAPTLYNAVGDRFGWSCVAWCGILLLERFKPFRKRRQA